LRTHNLNPILATFGMTQLTIQQALELALQHHRAGRLRDAEQIYEQILSRQPEHSGALHLMGVIARQRGRSDLAVDLIRRAVAVRPNFPEAYSNLGNALNDQGQIDEAIVAYRRAVTLRSDFADAYNNLGVVLISKGQVDEAIVACRQAITLRPNFAEAYSNLGSALTVKGHFDEAIAACRQAIKLSPNSAENYGNLANALKVKGQLDEAIAAYRHTIALRPEFAVAYHNLGVALYDKGQLDEAIAVLRQSIVLSPNYAEAHMNLGMTLLLRCDFQSGWPEYDWRLKLDDSPGQTPGFTQPLWDGSDLARRTILLHAEQGLGDAIQFIRYVPLVVQRGGRVVVQAPAESIRLLRQLPGVERWIASGEPLPPFDVHCPLLSLPRLFVTTAETIPPQKDSLLPDPELAQAWQDRLERQPAGFKVGLVWAGNPTHKNNHIRSIALSFLAPLATVSGVCFYSLQKGKAAKETANPPPRMRITDWTDELHDFADTAALVANLDLIISVDTSVAHLAGAMRKPVWLLLPFIPDWRWMLDRQDSPWYPTMRLFRQETRGSWSAVVSRIAKELSGLTQNLE
jgi:Flp pilus assembly protein TadD